MARHEHDDGDHAPADEAHEHAEDTEGEEPPEASAWFASSRKTSCPACGASGTPMLGGGIFCPGCGEVTTNPGYRSRPADDGMAGSDPGPD